MRELSLTELETKQSAVVKQIPADRGVGRRLETLGIRPGKRVTKISSHFWRGPVTVMVGKTKIAISYSVARRIMVEA